MSKRRDGVYKVAKRVRRFVGKAEGRRRGCVIAAVLNSIRKDFKEDDFAIVHFWVVKHAPGLPKGAKVFSLKTVNELSEKGAKFRDIYTYKKPLRRRLRFIASLLDVPFEPQHGFHAMRGVETALVAADQRDLWGNVPKGQSDLKSAFDQITRGSLYALLRVVFNINKELATWFSKVMTQNGHMFQGNPITPATFNLLSIPIAQEVRDKTGYSVVQYADDLTWITNTTSVSGSMLRWIENLVELNGWTVNREKSARVNGKQKFYLLGAVQDANGVWNAQRGRKIRRKAIYLLKQARAGRIWSRRIAKDGSPIALTAVVKGLISWLWSVRVNVGHSKYYRDDLISLLNQVDFVESMYEEEIRSIRIALNA